MSQVPNAHILLVEDFVFLIVRYHVVFDESVINNSRFYGFCVLLNFALRFQLITNVLLHILKFITLIY